MKLLVVCLFLFTSLAAHAVQNKMCRFVRSTAGDRGGVISITVSQRTLTVDATDGVASTGRFERDTGEEVDGQDNRRYLNYNNNPEQILVDEVLLQASGTGYIKFRSRADAVFGENIYYCY